MRDADERTSTPPREARVGDPGAWAPTEIRAGPELLSLRCGLRAQAGLLLPELGSELGTEVLRLKHLANLDLFSRAKGGALEPLDRFFHRPDLPEPEASHEFLRFRERPIDHRALSFRELDPLALRAGVEPLARQHDACLYQLFVVFSHLGEEFLRWKNTRLRLLASLHYHHDSHRLCSCCGSPGQCRG